MVPSYQFICQARERVVFKQPEQEMLADSTVDTRHVGARNDERAAKALRLSMIFFGKPVSTFPDHALAPHRQLDHVISMMDAELENRVLKFEFEAAGGPDTALCREGTAEHGAAIGQFSAFEATRDQFRNRQHGI